MTENSLCNRIKDFDYNYQAVLEKIEKASQRAGRNLNDISLLAATKTVPVEVIQHAVEQGIHYIGENRVQEYLDKYEHLKQNCQHHFIGQLQTNKVKYLVGKVQCIESVDSVKVAKEISRLSEKGGLTTEILVEVNIGHEENKGGIFPEKLFDFIEEIRHYPALSIQGLMAIPPICKDLGRLSAFFSEMRQYYVDIRAKKLDNVCMQRLSMGMSGDFELAIEYGANMVRLGSILFGSRK